VVCDMGRFVEVGRPSRDKVLKLAGKVGIGY
jgi:hypothetical protein